MSTGVQIERGREREKEASGGNGEKVSCLGMRGGKGVHIFSI